ncbi:MAG: hypothetical protein RDV48_12630 [Candidatus Eremiobacteraeota bacterium]|nr:hypothetical protein [Candidatus Eremiobacteraeota bacterium]
MEYLSTMGARKSTGDGRKSGARKVFFALMTLFLFFIVVEILLRLMVTPSPLSCGRFFGIELPPLKVIPGDEPALDTLKSSSPAASPSPESAANPSPSASPTSPAAASPAPLAPQEVSPGEPANDDLWGITREDEVLGYAPREGKRSTRGWWQSNSLGARRTGEVSFAKPPGVTRILVFGDSFTNCSRLKNDETWPHFLEKSKKDLEAVNFGTDGYSMGQCLLRYGLLKGKAFHDGMILMFVPGADLERDVNVCRNFMGWRTGTLIPRFIMKKGALELVKSPYRSSEEFYRENSSSRISPRLREHLRKYDSFYILSKYECPPLIGELITYKIWARVRYTNEEHRIREHLMDEGSEAMEVSRAIFEAMAREAGEQGAEFFLFVLPTRDNVKRYKTDTAFKAQWDRMAASLEKCPFPAVDLMKPFAGLEESQFDTGYDGTHYGPGINRRIASWVMERVGPQLKAR